MEKIKIRYDHLQARSGVAAIGENEIRFERIKVKGKFLVLFENRNGFGDKGRLKAVFNLNEYKIEVE